ATGVWRYALDNTAANVQALAAGQAVTDRLTVSSLDGTASATIAVTVSGANDPASIGGVLAGAVKEDTTLATAGTVTVADIDAGQSAFQAPAAAALVGTYGRFAFNAATGAWTYALDNASQLVQRLIEGQVVNDRLTVTSLDGTASRTIVVDVVGTRDAAEISGTIAGMVTEDAVLGTGGTLIIHDQDAGQSLFRAVAGGDLIGRYGSFAFDPVAGVWSYALDNTAPMVQALRGGQRVADTLTVWSNDGSASQLLTVTILGGTEPLPLAGLGTGGLRILGEAAYDNAGIAVAGLGDVNGDGRPDLLVTAPGSNGYAGAAYVVFGKAGGGTVPLADVAAGTGGYRITGEAAFGSTGEAAAAAGDVNGDGRPDLLLGAPYDGPDGSPAGAAYVVFGKAGGAAVSLGDVAAGSGGFKITGEAGSGLAGSSLAGIGDLNGDGRADVLVGAPGTGAGTAYVVFGKASGTPVSLAAVGAGNGGFKVTGEATGDAAGSAVAAIGDVNGDGRPDLLIGAPLNDQGGDQAGAAYVVFGKATGSAVSLAAVAAGSGGFKIAGEAAYDHAGAALAGIGDLNGDGRPDMLIAAPDNDPTGNLAGAVYVVWGKASGTPVNLADVAAGSGGFKITGAAAYDLAGWSVSGIGDLNGDGRPELLIGAPFASGLSGAAWLVWGKADGAPVSLADVTAGHGGLLIAGDPAEQGRAGYALAALGDQNGDGRPEILVSASNAGAAGDGAGAAWVVYSPPDWLGLA
ncbi:MAG: VCBS domain-containing protein, partial [Paracraurococcus sp.]